MSRKEILDNEELRKMAIGLAPDFFDGKKLDLNVLERGHCYPEIVPAIMKTPTERATAFLARLMGPRGADIPNHSELIGFWKRLKDLDILSPHFQPTIGQITEAAKPITSTGKTLEITSSWKDAWYLNKTTHANYEDHPDFARAHTNSIPNTVTRNILICKYERGRINIHGPLEHLNNVADTMTTTIARQIQDEEAKNTIESEFRLFELGTWPIGVDYTKTLHVFVPPEKPQQ